MLGIPASPMTRLGYTIDLAWQIYFERVVTRRIKVNKEASMQLHFASILSSLGQLTCIQPNELFECDLEQDHEGRSIDVICRFSTPSSVIQAAVELKCFRKKSNRALDLDMYDVLKDIERLLSYTGYQVRRFICLTDDARYTDGSPRSGHTESVCIGQGRYYKQGVPIQPSWKGRWENKSRDRDIVLSRDVLFDWTARQPWYYLKLDL